MGTSSQPFPPGAATRHLCIDMQRLFAEGTPWHVRWLREILPTIVESAGRYTRQTIFARFIPPRRPEEAIGAWRDYYAALT